MSVRSKCHLSFFVTIFLASFMLLSCSHQVINTQVKITTSKANLINTITTTEQFDIISNGIVAETQNKLGLKGIVSSTSDINNFDTVILLIDYEYLETDTFPLKNVYALKGKISLIDPKTKQVIFNDKVDEIEDKISDFSESLSKKISKKIIKYLYSNSNP